MKDIFLVSPDGDLKTLDDLGFSDSDCDEGAKSDAEEFVEAYFHAPGFIDTLACETHHTAMELEHGLRDVVRAWVEGLFRDEDAR